MDIKPTSFARGVPPVERNGFYGLEADLIEPLHDAKAVAAAVKLRDAAQKDRTGVEALDLPEVED